MESWIIYSPAYDLYYSTNGYWDIRANAREMSYSKALSEKMVISRNEMRLDANERSEATIIRANGDSK